MSLLAPINFRKAGETDYAAAIWNRNSSWGEFHGAMVREGWWNSLPGQAVAEFSLPSRASNQLYSERFAEGMGAPITPEERAGAGGRLQADLNAGAEERAAKQAEIEAELKARNIEFLTEEQWRGSTFYREKLPFEPFTTPARAAAVAEIHDKNEFRRRLLSRREMGLTDYVTGFGAAMIGSLPDPTNLVAFGALRAAWALKAASRMGRVLRTGTVGAGENLLATAAQLPLLDASQARFGDELTWGDALLDLATATVLGFGLAGGARGIGELRQGRAAGQQQAATQAAQAGQQAVAALPTGQQAPDLMALGQDGGGVAQPWHAEANVGWHQAQEALAKVTLAAKDLAETGRVSVGQVMERRQVARGYDRTLREGPHGNPEEVLAAINRSDLEKVLLTRGAALERNGEIMVSGRALGRALGTERGYGLVKVLWRHGEMSDKGPSLRVTRDDVLALPDVIRGYDPLPGGRGNQREWRVARGGRTLVYATAKWDGKERVVSIHVLQGPDERGLSLKRDAGAAPRSSGELAWLPGDTASVASRSPAEGPGAAPAPLNVEAAVVFRNLEGAPAEPDWVAETRAAVEQAKAEAGLDAEGGFAEQAQFEAMKEAGLLTKEELADFDAAMAEAKRLAKSPEAFDAAAMCALGGLA